MTATKKEMRKAEDWYYNETIYEYKNKLYEIIHIIYLWREGILRGEKMYLIFISLHYGDL